MVSASIDLFKILFGVIITLFFLIFNIGVNVCYFIYIVLFFFLYLILSFAVFQSVFALSLFECRLTSRRLGEVAASTAVVAGHKVSNLHFLFCGATATITPNRSLAAVYSFVKL
jgi:hypothetical protein